MAGAFPFDLKYLLGGPCRVLRAPLTEAIPDRIEDIFEVVGPDYAPAGDWEDFGATTDAASYERGFESEEWRIEQATSAVHEEITETVRTFSVPIGEISSDHLAIFEESTGVEQITGPGVEESAQDRVPFGNITSLTQYRIAFARQRPTGKGADITDPGLSKLRGGFVVGVLYACQLSADSAEVEMARGGGAASLPLQFSAFPVEGETEGEEVGAWFTEDGPQIVAAT